MTQCCVQTRYTDTDQLTYLKHICAPLFVVDLFIFFFIFFSTFNNSNFIAFLNLQWYKNNFCFYSLLAPISFLLLFCYNLRRRTRTHKHRPTYCQYKHLIIIYKSFWMQEEIFAPTIEMDGSRKKLWSEYSRICAYDGWFLSTVAHLSPGLPHHIGIL